MIFSYALNYVAFTFLVFILTFYIGVFIRYIRTRTIVTQKMLTTKKGGLFEHYVITPIIVFIVVLLDVIFEASPFYEGNWLNIAVWTITLSLIAYVFLVFIFILTFYLITFLYTKIFKVEDRRKIYEQHSHKMILTALIVSLILIISVLIPVVTTMISGAS